MAILPLYNVLVLPGAKIWLRRTDYRTLTGKDAAVGERVTVLIQKENGDRDALTADSFYPIAVAGQVTETDQSGFITMEMGSRVNIDEIVQLPDRSFSMSVSRRPDSGTLEPEEAARFVAESGCDSLAVSIGTSHGVYKTGTPSLSFDALHGIAAALPDTPLVLHGGSGTGDENLSRCAKEGIAKVNIFTGLHSLPSRIRRLRITWR